MTQKAPTRLLFLFLIGIYHAGSLRLHGNAQIAQSTFSIQTQVITCAGSQAIQTTINNNLRGKQPLLGTDSDPILQMPGAITINSTDQFQIETAGNPSTPPQSINLSDILILQASSDNFSSNAYTGLLIGTGEGDLTENVLKIGYSTNYIRYATNTSGAQVEANLLTPLGSNNIYNDEGTDPSISQTQLVLNMTNNSTIRYFRTSDDTNDVKFVGVTDIISDPTTGSYYLVSADSTATNRPIYIVGQTDMPDPDTVIEHDTLNYYSIVLGGGVDFALDNSAVISTELSLEAPIESIEHEASYYSINPEISLQLDLGLKVGNRHNTLGFHLGKKYTRYTSEVIEYLGNGNPIFSVTKKNNEYFSQAFSSLTASIEVTPSIQGHIEYQVLQKQDKVDLEGSVTNFANVTGHRVSLGFSTAVQFR
jgi:hypothetical protein